MKLLYQLSKRFLLIILFSLLSLHAQSDTKDIWKQSKEIEVKEDKKENKNSNQNINTNLNKDLPKTVFDQQKLDLSINKIDQSMEINDQEVIFGLYEPDEIKIDLNFWSDIDKNLYSQFIKTLSKNNRKSLIELSQKILFTKSNINVFDDKGTQHLNFLSDWLIINQKMELIDQVINQNKIINQNAKFLNFLFKYYLSLGQIDKACSYTNLMTTSSQNLDLEKFKIYCLVHNKKIKQAQSQLELSRENSSLDNFFLDKINYLTNISENKGKPNFNNVFNAHLSILTHNELELKYENFSKSKELRNYFFKSGLAVKLLDNAMVQSSSDNKDDLNNLVIFLERSVNEDLFNYEKILEIYKKYNFSFIQLFEVNKAITSLKRPESHAILYQAMLLAQQPEIRLNILKDFKDKLTLNGLEKIADPVYYNELKKIYDIKANLINQSLLEEISTFQRSQEVEVSDYNNSYLYSSELKKLFIENLDKKTKKKILKILDIFDKKLKENKYKLSNKDIAFINLLNLEKIDLPKSMSQTLYDKKVYIPNEIFNSLEKKLNNEVILKTLLYLNNLDENDKDYTRNILAIAKVFDSIKLKSLKFIFINSEFAL